MLWTNIAEIALMNVTQVSQRRLCFVLYFGSFVAGLDFGRSYARDVKVVKANLTSETLKQSGIKTGRLPFLY